MKKRILFLVFQLTIAFGHAQVVQDTIRGSVSFKTSQNIYVKFQSTREIEPGDTLYSFQQGILQPALVVHQLSSTTCVGSLISPVTISLNDTIFSIQEKQNSPLTTAPTPVDKAIIIEEPKVEQQAEEKEKTTSTSKKLPTFRGRISAASYFNFADVPGYDVQRLRYTFTLNSREPLEKGFSVETYLSFRHTANEWQEVKDNFSKALKVYTLAVQYKLNKNTRVWLGRKINFNISNLGAIDGVQMERQWKHVIVGAFFGTRPDYQDYGLNLDLVQYGSYFTHITQNSKGQALSTISLAEQRNHGVTDRRFLYVQHQNSTIKNISLFTSSEIDLYTIKNNQPQFTFLLSSIYASVRYRASRKLSLFASYDARKNIIYYETYKSFIDQLLEDEMRQGLRFSFNAHPAKKVTLGASAGYRFDRNLPQPAQNLNSYMTINQFTSLRISATISAILLQTSYLKGNIYGVRIAKDFMKGKLYEEAEFRNVVYRYGGTELPIKQQIVGLNSSFRLNKKLSLSVNYEGEIQTSRSLHRIYSNIVYRI